MTLTSRTTEDEPFITAYKRSCDWQIVARVMLDDKGKVKRIQLDTPGPLDMDDSKRRLALRKLRKLLLDEIRGDD